MSVRRSLAAMAILAAAMGATSARAAGPLGPAATIGVAKINTCFSGCGTEYVAFQLTGTFAVAGSLYVGQLAGVAHDVTDFGSRVVLGPFALAGSSPAGAISL